MTREDIHRRLEVLLEELETHADATVAAEVMMAHAMRCGWAAFGPEGLGQRLRKLADGYPRSEVARSRLN